MTDVVHELNHHFRPSSADGLPQDVLGELESILRLHSISPQELFYKWESYSFKMGAEDTMLDLDTVRMFKKDTQDGIERGTRENKYTARTEQRRNLEAATPKANISGDMFGMYD